MKYKIDFIIAFVSIIISSFFLGVLLSELVREKFMQDVYLESYDNTECANLSLEEGVACLVGYVNTFYEYKVRDPGKTLVTIEDLKLNGGDCSEWGVLYKKIAQELGYEARTIDFHGNEMGHRFVLVWDKELSGYCVIDGRNYHCQGLGELE